MFSMTPVTLVFGLLFSQALPALSYAVAGRDSGKIAGLLQHSKVGARRSLSVRQAGTCDLGYHACSDFDGCCQDGTNCGVWGGKPGCCPIGENCIANDDPCVYQGDLPCANFDFCCPAGDTCYRDAAGNALCSSTGGTSIVGTATPTTTRLVTPTTTSVDNTVIPGTSTVKPPPTTVTPIYTTPKVTTTSGGFQIPTPSISNPLGSSATSLTSGRTVICMVVAGLLATLIPL